MASAKKPFFPDIEERIQSDYGNNPAKTRQENIADLQKKTKHYEKELKKDPIQRKAYESKLAQADALLATLLRPSVDKQKPEPNSNIHAFDLLEPKHTDDLVQKWETNVNSAVRDALLEDMTRKGVRPEQWIVNRDLEAGLYPDISDPDFAAKLSRKTEYASLRSGSIEEDTCQRSKRTFEKTAVQRLIARFLHPATPYNGLLLHHGVGVGKTCSAITVAETFLEQLPMNVVYIIVPQAIADGFRRTIFDVSLLKPNTAEEFRLTGERWSSPQCTGSTYLHLTGMAGSTNLEEIADAVDQEIKRRYKIMGYLAFANFVESKKKEVPSALTGQDRIDAEHAILLSLFSDHLIIVDEAHNLRDVEDDSEEADKAKVSDASEGKKLTPLLKQILRVAEGLRLMFMTATPMYNTAPEIVFLLNLLHLNDTKNEDLWIRTNEIFREEDSSFVEGGEAKLETLIRRYVSFMRGEHPNTFPLRLTPPSAIPADFVYPTVSMKIGEGELSMPPESLDRKILYNLPLVVHTVDESTKMGETLTNELRAHAERGLGASIAREVTNLDGYIQMGNLVYPDGTYGKTGFGNHFEEKRIHKTIQYVWKKKTPTLDSVFGSGLRSHSPKMVAIVESITKAQGISFVFSRYKKAGAIPLAIALEMAGWCRVLSNGTLAPLLKREFVKPPTMFYVLLTSDKDFLSPDFKGLLQYATTFQNAAERNGSKVKAILGSQIASEGLDLKCIRELHLLEGWFHLNRIEQIEGRGVRFCSHADLPPAERNCLIYLHALNVAKYETPDLYMYRIAVRKAQPIGRVTRLMKINAWDCMLNRDAILLAELPKRTITDAQGRTLNGYDVQDKEYSSFCDFSERCIFECSAKVLSGANNSTYKKDDFRKQLLHVQERLADVFSDDVAWPIEDVRNIYKLNGIPWSIAEIGLRECLGRMKIKRTDGILGTLLYVNGYIVFQPDRVTDERIPLAMRYGRAYGILPREFVQTRPILGLSQPEEPVDKLPLQKEKKAKAHKPPIESIVENNGPVNRIEALHEFAKWKVLLEEILTKPVGSIALPSGIEAETLYGWRWTFYKFRSLPNIRSIAYRWWIDNFWSWRERIAVLSEWMQKGQTEELDLFRPNEYVSSPELRALYACDPNNLPHVYCQTNLRSEPAVCPSILLPEVEKMAPPPVDRMEDTESIYGFSEYDKGVMISKTVLQKKGKGLQCVGTSNLPQFTLRMIEIHSHLRAELGDRLLQDSEATKPSAHEIKERKAYYTNRYKGKMEQEDASLDAKHIYDLSLKQICPYLELLLRYADSKRIGGKRWFLSAVDMARIHALPKK